MQTHIPVLLLSLGLLSTVTCYLRGDYNPALYIISYFLWDFKFHIRQTLVYLILYSWLIDLVWTLTSLLLWRTDSFTSYHNNFHNTTLIASAILFALKLFLIVFMVVTSQECRKWLKPGVMVEQLSKFCGGPRK